MISYRLSGLLLASTLAVWSSKPDASAAPAAQPVATTASAPAASPAADRAITVQRRASLDCDDRTIVVALTCSGEQGDAMLMCSRQSLTVADRATGAARSAREFVPSPNPDKSAAPRIDEVIGALICIRTKKGERYILARMYKADNCEECQWHDLYDWDGKLVATDRERRSRHAVFNALTGGPIDKSNRILGERNLLDLYSGRRR